MTYSITRNKQVLQFLTETVSLIKLENLEEGDLNTIAKLHNEILIAKKAA